MYMDIVRKELFLTRFHYFSSYGFFFFHVKCSVSSALILLLDCSITILIAGEGKEVNSLCNQL